jgi:hypothetical protein
MKKLTTLFTTTMIALALMMAAPTAMAGEKGNGYGAFASAFCKANDNTILGVEYKNHGACVSAGVALLKYWI